MLLTQERLNPGHYEANIIADSVSEADHRLTTFVITFPRLVLAEYNTHRVLSRNSASTRAIPVSTQLLRVLDDPFIPERFGVQQPGMEASRFAEGVQHSVAVKNWLLGRDIAVLGAVASLGGLNSVDPTTGKPMLNDDLKDRVAELDSELGYSKLLANRIGADPGLESVLTDYLSSQEVDEIFNLSFLEEPLHKQLAGRPLEPWMWQTVLTTGTEWRNFFALRNSPAAQPEIMMVARNMQEAYEAGNPQLLLPGEWHTPIIGFEGDETLSLEEKKKASTGRCARVSYLTHGNQRDVKADFGLHDGLLSNGHMSPFEHPARPQTEEELAKYPEFDGMVVPLHGNFKGFHQYRKDIPNEDNFGAKAA
ncbi:MAG: hypothetical protein QG623_107 [Patescibacteria group bacterium]|nr:hypothetical protein [Patescibacteria group bacterium]